MNNTLNHYKTSYNKYSLKQVGIQNRVFSTPMILLLVLITSFFYVLPLGRFKIGVFSSDIRIYDFVFIIYMLFAGRYQMPRLFVLINNDKQFHRYAVILIGLVVFSLGLTWVLRGPSEILPVFIRVYRFMMYFLVGSFAFITLRTPKRQRIALGVFYGNVIIQTLLGFAQSMKWIPSFWPDYWLVSYGAFPVGTLSPHHLQIGVVMLIGIALSMFFFRIWKNILIRIILSLLMCMMAIVAIHAEIRTAWFALPAWLIAYVLIYRKHAIWPLTVLMAGVLIVFFLIGQPFMESTQEVIFRRIIDPLSYEGLRGIIGDREQIYEFDLINQLISKPWIILVGAGFQNVSYVLRGATGAHNNYLQAFFELGIFGLFFYFLFLKSIFMTILNTIKLAKKRFEKYLASDVLALFVAILFTMLAGETMWAQYSMFTLTGQIMVVVAIASCPLNWRTARGSNSD